MEIFEELIYQVFWIYMFFAAIGLIGLSLWYAIEKTVKFLRGW